MGGILKLWVVLPNYMFGSGPGGAVAALPSAHPELETHRKALESVNVLWKVVASHFLN